MSLFYVVEVLLAAFMMEIVIFHLSVFDPHFKIDITSIWGEVFVVSYPPDQQTRFIIIFNTFFPGSESCFRPWIEGSDSTYQVYITNSCLQRDIVVLTFNFFPLCRIANVY